MAPSDSPPPCTWVSLKNALAKFTLAEDGTEGAAHIRPQHWYVACRLVVEGGFHPDDITPHPPFKMEWKRKRWHLIHDVAKAGTGERPILGGLKTKNVDVVTVKDGIGPVMAVSVKGTLNAFRNLTNRMEEAVGDCTNLHISYPILVYGFLHVLRANRASDTSLPNDLAFDKNGKIAASIVRYHDILTRLSGRNDLRDDLTKYEAVGMILADPDPLVRGEILTAFPPPDSPLFSSDFFTRLYTQYDQRFVYAAPSLQGVTRRVTWHPDSPAFSPSGAMPDLDYQPRIADDEYPLA